MRRSTVAIETWVPVIIHVMLGLVLFPHGAQKLFGWFGGFGFNGTMGYFTETVGLPWILGLAVILLESLGALLLVLGLGTRYLAAAYVLLAIGIIFSSHLGNGFFMNWFKMQAGEGYEYFLLWIAMALSLVFTGGGKYSLDAWLKKTIDKHAVIV